MWCGGISPKTLGKRSQKKRSIPQHASIDEIVPTDHLRCQGQERSPLRMTVFEAVPGIPGHGDVLFLDLGVGLVSESSCWKPIRLLSYDTCSFLQVNYASRRRGVMHEGSTSPILSPTHNCKIHPALLWVGVGTVDRKNGADVIGFPCYFSSPFIIFCSCFKWAFFFLNFLPGIWVISQGFVCFR